MSSLVPSEALLTLARLARAFPEVVIMLTGVLTGPKPKASSRAEMLPISDDYIGLRGFCGYLLLVGVALDDGSKDSSNPGRLHLLQTYSQTLEMGISCIPALKATQDHRLAMSALMFWKFSYMF